MKLGISSTSSGMSTIRSSWEPTLAAMQCDGSEIVMLVDDTVNRHTHRREFVGSVESPENDSAEMRSPLPADHELAPRVAESCSSRSSEWT